MIIIGDGVNSTTSHAADLSLVGKAGNLLVEIVKSSSLISITISDGVNSMGEEIL